MKVILSMVLSLDGKSTKKSLPPSYWASREDQTHFLSLLGKHQVVIMGKNTFLSVRPHLRLNPRTLRVVITSTPKKFSEYKVSNQLEFHALPPTQLLAALERRGYTKALLVGGPELNSSFFRSRQIHELWITLEPAIFGKGLGLIEGSIPKVSLTLYSKRKLNKQGTLLLKYKVAYAH